MSYLQFTGKNIVYAHHLTVPVHGLQPDAGKSRPPPGKPAGLDGNLIIHGDNLLALKALLPRYGGKVNCIYIDPPYNTGNEDWAYNDRVNSPLMKTWLNKLVNREDLERHEKWLCMMWPRLHLLRELLSDDGVIFVSIDDNEQHRLRAIMDEIFGEQNFRNIFAVRRYDKNISRQFMDRGMFSMAVGFEYILAYAKSPDFTFTPVLRDSSNGVREHGYWKGFWNAADRPTMRYALLGVKPERGQWKWKKSVAEEAVGNYEDYLAKSSDLALEEYWDLTGQKKKFIRRRPELTKGMNQGVEHWVPPDEGVLVSSNWSDILASERTLGNLGVTFPAPKSVALLKRILSMATNKDSLILDSFAGSGTTAQAVLALNQQDGGQRRFILVECENYADSITAERVRRVMNGVKESRNAALRQGLGGAFTFCTLGARVDADALLNGDAMPSYDDLARYVFNTATGKSLTDVPRGRDGFIGEAGGRRLHLIYKQDAAFMGSREAALTRERAASIKAAAPDGQSIAVFAAVSFVSQSELSRKRILFCQLPWEIYRLA